MIRAETGEAFDRLIARLTRRAATVAAASATARRLARHNADARWRRADLLWPLFTKGSR